MPIIKRREKQKKSNVGLRLNEETASKLEKYAEFTNVSKAEIVDTVLNQEFNSNTEFMKSLGSIENKPLTKVQRRKTQHPASAAA